MDKSSSPRAVANLTSLLKSLAMQYLTSPAHNANVMFRNLSQWAREAHLLDSLLRPQYTRLLDTSTCCTDLHQA